MLRKSIKKTIFVVLFIFVLSSAAMALSPHNALSSKPAESFYTVISVNDLNGLLRTIFSPANLSMVKSMMGPQEALGVDMVSLFVSQIPANTVVFNAGMTAEMIPFVQAAAAMPDSARSRLDKIADGSATGVDIVTLLMGDAGAALAGGFEPEVQKGEKGPFYSLQGQVVFAAKENLLLMATSQAELEASIDALENEGNRLAFKRRFDSPNYWLIHVDYNSLARIAGAIGDENLAQLQVLTDLFKAPLEIEFAFTPNPDSFLISCAVNVLESVADTESFKDKKPVIGGGMFLAGGGKMLLALSSPIAFNKNQLRMYPKVLEAWDEVMSELAAIDISEGDIESMLNGSVSLSLGSDATIMGMNGPMNVPGGYITLTGQEGVAARILGKLVSTQAAPLVPIQVDDWEMLYTVNQGVLPMPIHIGVMKDTLFLGFVDSEALGKKPELSPEVAKMLEAPLFGAGVIDTGAIWNRMRQESASPQSILALIPGIEAVKAILDDILEADLSVPLIRIWSPELEVSFTELSIADVPEEKQLLKRIMKYAEMFK